MARRRKKPLKKSARTLQHLTDEEVLRRIILERKRGKKRYVSIRSPEQLELYFRRHPTTRTRWCRWCLNTCPKTTQTFCSPNCVKEWKFRSSGTVLRKAVFHRDKGRCAVCQKNSKAWQREIWEEYQLIRALKGYTAKEIQAKIDRLCRAEGIVEGDLWKSPWEADHIVAVIDGGGMCGLENLQTLCIVCHRAKKRTTGE